MSDRLFRLMERHQKLDEALRRLQSARWADPFEVARLKKIKLALRDTLARMTARKGSVRKGANRGVRRTAVVETTR